MGRGHRKSTRNRKRKARRLSRGRPRARWCAPGNGIGAGTRGGVVQGQVGERLENLRLLAAVAAEVADPAAVPGLAGELQGLSEYDRLLTLGLDVFDREGEPEDPFFRARQRDLFAIGARIRGQIRALLPWGLRARVQQASESVEIREADVWADVRALRASGRDRVLLLPDGFGAPGAGPLPRSGTIEPWLRRLPVPWLEAIATQHGAEGLTESERLPFVIGVLRDEGHLAACLRERLDDEALRVLIRYTAAGEVLRATLSPAEEADLAPAWDGRGVVPAGSGVRLRALGLLHIGTRDGFVDVVVQPDELRVRLARLLVAGHDELLQVLGPRRLSYLEAAAERPDPSDVPR